MKGKATLALLGFIEGTDTLCDMKGENQQKINVPLVLTGGEGLSTEAALKIGIDLTPDQVADLVHLRNNNRYAVMILDLEPTE